MEVAHEGDEPEPGMASDVNTETNYKAVELTATTETSHKTAEITAIK
jgi:hypothetical protein